MAGGSTRVVGENEVITLDASRSSDPDGSVSPSSFLWGCEDEDEGPCFEPSNQGKVQRLKLNSESRITINVAKSLKRNKRSKRLF